MVAQYNRNYTVYRADCICMHRVDHSHGAHALAAQCCTITAWHTLRWMHYCTSTVQMMSAIMLDIDQNHSL